VKVLFQSPTVRSMVVYALSGVGFTGSNLILARVLPTEQYALFTLVIGRGCSPRRSPHPRWSAWPSGSSAS
jgi:hypothetical protein